MYLGDMKDWRVWVAMWVKTWLEIPMGHVLE